VGANPSGIAVNEATHTVYVVNDGDNTVSVIDADACNAQHLSGCGSPLATIALGPSGPSGPVAAILSPDGATLYVTSPGGANSVAVIDAATCKAINTSGCADGPVASVATGNGPVALDEDPLSQTLYVTNIADNTVSVIDGQRCNAQQTAGCGESAPTVTVGTAPVAVAVDVQAQTVYVGNLDDDTVSVIDARRCNGEHPAGCGETPSVQAVGGGPDGIAVSPGGSIAYVADSGTNDQGASVAGGNTVSVLDARICNAASPQGCSAVPAPAVAVGAGQGNQPQAVAVDPQTHNVYVTDDNDDTLSVIDGTPCGWHDVSGCVLPAPTVQTGADPTAVAVDPTAHTIYVLDAVDDAVAVIADPACIQSDPMACRPAPAPAAPLAPNDHLTEAAVDPAQHTAYVISSGVNGTGPYALDLIDTTKCNAGDTTGCDPHPPLATVALPSSPSDIALDPSTETLYVSEGGPGPDQLEVIAAASCNATVTSCAKTATIPFAGGVPQDIALDSATHTVYVGFPTEIAVIDTRHQRRGHDRLREPDPSHDPGSLRRNGRRARHAIRHRPRELQRAGVGERGRHATLPGRRYLPVRHPDEATPGDRRALPRERRRRSHPSHALRARLRRRRQPRPAVDNQHQALQRR
jgi:YVTN family beta-propeller protein